MNIHLRTDRSSKETAAPDQHQGESVCVDTVSCWNSPYTDILNIGSPRSRKQWLSLSTIYLRFDRRQETMQHVNPTNTPAHSKRETEKGGEQGWGRQRGQSDLYGFQLTEVYHFRPSLRLQLLLSYLMIGHTWTFSTSTVGIQCTLFWYLPVTCFSCTKL